MDRDEQTDYRNGCSCASKSDELNATSSKRPIEDCVLGEGSTKRGRLNGVEYQNREDETNRNCSRQNNERSVSVSQEAKRQHFWDAMSYNSNQRSFLMDNERDPGQSSNMSSSQHGDFDSESNRYGSSRAEFSGHSCLGFLQTGTAMEGCSTSSGSGPSWRMGSLSRDCDNKRIVAASCSGDGEGLSANSRDQSVDVRGKRFIFDNNHREISQAIEDHAGQTDNVIANLNMPCDGRDYMNSPRRPLHIPENEFPEERRATRRRRLSTTGFLDTASTQSSRPSSLWGENFLDGPRSIGLLRSDEGPCSSMNFNMTVNDPMMTIWDDFHDNNALRSNSGFISSNVEASRPEISSSNLFRSIQDEPLNLSSEPSNNLQVHSLFASSSSQPIALPQPQSLDLTHSEQQQQAESHRSRTGSGSNLDQLCNERANSSSNLVIGRGNLSIPRFVVRDRFDGSRMSGVSNRSTRGVRRALLDSSLGSQSTSSQILGSSANRTDVRGHGHRIVNSLSDSGGAAHVLALMPNAQSNSVANRSLLPPGLPGPSSNRGGLVNSSRVPRRSQSGQHPSSARAALFVDGVDGLPRSRIQNILGLPFNGSHLLSSNGDQRRRLLSEILSTLEQASRGDELNYEELMMLDPSVIYRGIDANDQHRDMRLDVDNMSYEELLALEERIGDVSTGLSEEMISACVCESKYSSLDATVAALSQESDVKCSVCQEEFIEDDELGRLDCGHGYHMVCIKQWLLLKNLCPICKAAAYTKS